MTLNSPHPFTHILSDCLSIVFSYHIQPITQNHTEFSPFDLLFFRKCIVCWNFARHVKVGEFLERTRGNKLKLQYVSARNNIFVNDEVFKLFRGIRELDVQQGHESRPRFTDEALENLRDIETLDISHCHQLTSSSFVNLRGIKDLKIEGLEDLDDSALEQLRGIERLDMSYCRWVTDSGMVNLRGIKVLNIGYCPRLTDACFENFRGVHELRMRGYSQPNLSSAALVNLRGVNVFFMRSDNIPGEALENVIGVQEVSIGGCYQVTDEHLKYLVGVRRCNLFGCDQITGAGLQYLRGVQEINLVDTNINDADDFSPLREATVVYISNLSLNEEKLSNFRRVKSFRAVYCRYIDIAAFANLSNVEELHLESNLKGLTDETFKHMHKLRNLALIDNEGGPFTKNLLENLPRSLDILDVSTIRIALDESDVDAVARCLMHLSELRAPRESKAWQMVLEKKWKKPVWQSFSGVTY